MKTNNSKVAYYLYLLVIINLTINAQDNWTWLNPKPMGSSVESCGYFPGTNTIIAAGRFGLIMRSSDNGLNWSHIQSNLTINLLSVSITSSTTGYISGESAVLLKTTDAGVTWTSKNTGLSGNFAQIDFVDEQTGYVRIENAVHFTSDGGNSWTNLSISTDFGSLNSIHAISNSELYVGTFTGYVFKTPPLPDAVPACSSSVVSIEQFDGKIIAVASDKEIVYSTDNGSNWSHSSGTFTDLSFKNASVISSDLIVAYTSIGQIVKSSDGITWTSILTSGSNSLTSASGNLAGEGIILGSNGNQYSTDDAGASWTKNIDTVTTSNINSIFTLDGTTIWAAGNGGVMIKSTDSGISWTTLTTNITTAINDVEFLDSDVGYFVSGTTIYKSTNGGDLWSVFKVHSGILYEVTLNGANNIIIAASNQKLFCTTNGGVGWSTNNAGTAGEHYSVYYLNSSTAFSVGSTGKIFKTGDNGVVWSEVKTGTGTLNSICFSTESIGWAVGNSGKRYKTTDSGGSWALDEDELTSNNLQSVRFSDPLNGIIVGNLGTILKTTDGGTTWNKSAQITENNLMSASLVNGSTTFVAGNSGTIIKSSNAPLPVELVNFSASVKNNKVELKWETATEIDNYGFEIHRKTKNSDWEKIGFVEGHFTSNSPKYYNFTDIPSGTGKHSYRLKQIDNDGKFEYSGIVEVDLSGMLPKDIEIKNFPNPFNPVTNINIKLPETAETTIELYNSTGEKIYTIYKGKLEAGTTWALKLDGSNLPSGVYLIHVTAGKYRKTHKILLMK